MVSKKHINNIFDKIIHDWGVKCPTIEEMKASLSGMTPREQFKELQEKGLLNPLEEKHYEKYLISDVKFYEITFEEAERNLNRAKENPDTTEEELQEFQRRYDLMKGRLDDVNNEVFQYGRRLIEGLKPLNPVPEIDKSRYKEDDEIGWDSLNSKMGGLEKSQINSQQKTVNVDPNDLSPVNIGTEDNPNIVFGKMNDKRLLAMNRFFNGDTANINYTISSEGYLKALNKEQRKQVKYIDSLMEESPGLLEDTILYRAGYFDIHLRVGDHTSFKGYQSTSFQKETMDLYYHKAVENNDWNTMKFIIHAPKGTKGLCGNDDRFENGFLEHEYALPRNTGYIITNIDYENMTVEVVLDE